MLKDIVGVKQCLFLRWCDCSAAAKLEKSGGHYSLCVLVFFNIHLLINLVVKEIEIQATKMENLDNSKEAGAGIKSAIYLRSFLLLLGEKGQRNFQ